MPEADVSTDGPRTDETGAPTRPGDRTGAGEPAADAARTEGTGAGGTHPEPVGTTGTDGAGDDTDAAEPAAGRTAPAGTDTPAGADGTPATVADGTLPDGADADDADADGTDAPAGRTHRAPDARPAAVTSGASGTDRESVNGTVTDGGHGTRHDDPGEDAGDPGEDQRQGLTPRQARHVRTALSAAIMIAVGAVLVLRLGSTHSVLTLAFYGMALILSGSALLLSRAGRTRWATLVLGTGVAVAVVAEWAVASMR